MKISLSYSLSFCLVFLCWSYKDGLARQSTVSTELEDAMQTIFLEKRDPALSISIQHNGRSLLNKAFGHADFEEKRLATTQTRFKNASTGKVFVSLALQVLAYEKKVDLDRPIGHYIPGLNVVLRNITSRQLLSHTAGLKDYVNDFGASGPSQQLAYARKLDEDIIFTQPGTLFSYSNSGYNISGAVIEAVTGKGFNQAMKELVFDRIDMPLTTYILTEVPENGVAYGHSGTYPSFSKHHRIPDNADERASGMAFTTAAELNKLLTWLISDEGSEADQYIRSQMLQVIADTDRTGANWQYGYGLFHSVYCGKDVIWHTGGMPGYSALFLAVPEDNFSVAILSNGPNSDRWKMALKSMEMVLDADCSSQNQSPKLIPFSNEEAKQLVGVYSQGIGARITIRQVNGELRLSTGGQSYQVLKNDKGQLVTIDKGKPGRIYSPTYGDDGQATHIQYWVRAYPRVR